MTNLSEKMFFGLTILLIAVISFVIYSNSFDTSFHFDDYIYLADVYPIRNLSNIKEIWSFNERPFLIYTYALNYHFGKLNVFGYHIVNLVIHILCGILVYLFLYLTFGLPSLKDKYSGLRRWIAFFGCLIFIVHPVKTEAVTYISGRSESLASLFYLLRGYYDQAIVKFKEVIQRWPDYSSAHSNLGTVYRKKGMLKEAESEFKEALGIIPNFAEAHANLGLVYIQMKRFDEAYKELKEGCRLNPDISEPHVNPGLLYQNFNQNDKAMDEFTQAVNLNPNYPFAQYCLGLTYFGMGRIDEAMKHLAILERLDPALAQKFKQKIQNSQQPSPLTGSGGRGPSALP